MAISKNFEYMPQTSATRLRPALKAAAAYDVALQEQILLSQLQPRIGVQVVVEKAISDLLLHTDLPEGLKPQDIPWLHQHLEVYFEDPQLPTMVGGYMTQAQRLDALGLTLDDIAFDRANPTEGRLVMCMPDPEGVRTLIAADSRFGLVVMGENPLYDIFEILGLGRPNSKPTLLLLMTRLVIAVMFYAATTREAVTSATRKQLHFGGKAGVKGRPETAIKRVVCLPQLKAAAAESSSGNRGLFKGERKAHPRRGHFRTFTAERFVNVRGKVVFIPPTWVHGVESKLTFEYRVGAPPPAP